VKVQPPSPQQNSKLKRVVHQTEGNCVDTCINDLQANFEEMVKAVNGNHSSTVESLLQGTNFLYYYCLCNYKRRHARHSLLRLNK
jgi:hypothetical protein